MRRTLRNGADGAPGLHHAETGRASNRTHVPTARRPRHHLDRLTSACRRRRRMKGQSIDKITNPSGSIQMPSTGRKLKSPPRTNAAPTRVRPKRVSGSVCLRALIQAETSAASSETGMIPRPSSLLPVQFHIWSPILGMKSTPSDVHGPDSEPRGDQVPRNLGIAVTILLKNSASLR